MPLPRALYPWSTDHLQVSSGVMFFPVRVDSSMAAAVGPHPLSPMVEFSPFTR